RARTAHRVLVLGKLRNGDRGGDVVDGGAANDVLRLANHHSADTTAGSRHERLVGGVAKTRRLVVLDSGAGSERGGATAAVSSVVGAARAIIPVGRRDSLVGIDRASEHVEVLDVRLHKAGTLFDAGGVEIARRVR